MWQALKMDGWRKRNRSDERDGGNVTWFNKSAGVPQRPAGSSRGCTTV